MALKDGEFDDSKEQKESIPLSSFRPKEEPKKEEEGKEKVSEIEIDPKKKSSDNKQSFDIKNSSFIKDFASQHTRPSDTSEKEIPSGPKETVEDIRARLAVEEKEEVGKLSVEDFEDAADFIIDLIDMSLLFAVRWYSQDISDAEYKVPEEKLKKLKKHLSRLLMRVGKKFPMGILFVLGILAAYATPIRKAHEHRKKVQAEKTRKKIRTESKSDTGTGSESEEEEDEDNPKYVPLPKKKRGGNAK